MNSSVSLRPIRLVIAMIVLLAMVTAIGSVTIINTPQGILAMWGAIYWCHLFATKDHVDVTSSYVMWYRLSTVFVLLALVVGLYVNAALSNFLAISLLAVALVISTCVLLALTTQLSVFRKYIE